MCHREYSGRQFSFLLQQPAVYIYTFPTVLLLLLLLLLSRV